MKSRSSEVPTIETLMFRFRGILLALFAVVTVALGYNASRIQPDASFIRMIPAEHPYIVNMIEHRDDLENLGNFVRVAVAAREGDIFEADFQETLRQITDEMFYLPGIDRSGLKSIWTPNVRWVEVTEMGFQGGKVIPDGYDGSDYSLEQLRQNILRSGEVGSLVADDFRSAIVYAPLYETNPETGEPLDYRALSEALEEKIRDQYQQSNPNVSIHIVGFAKKVGDLIEGIGAIAWFAGITIMLTAILLFWYSRCKVSTAVPVLTSLIAVIWQLGLLRILGYGLDPYSVLVPFLVFAIGISHGVQLINRMAYEAASGRDRTMAARHAFRALYRAGALALVSDAFGFLTLLFIGIAVIRDLAVSAGLGVAIVILTNLILLPLLMSLFGVSRSGIAHARNRKKSQDVKWRRLSYLAHPTVAPISLMLALIGFGLGLSLKQDLKVGDLERGAPELRQDSRYNRDNAFIIDNYSTSADVLVVMVETQPQACTTYPVLRTMDELQWRLQNTPGVQSSVSIADVSRIVTKALNEGNWKWFALSLNQDIINASLRQVPSGFINSDCSLTPLLVFLEDHKAETLDAAVATVEAFAAQYNSQQATFLLAAGNAGVEAATNQVISQAKNQMLLFVYAVVSLLCLLMFRSWRAVLCIVIPLGLTSILCEAVMAITGIGIKVATLPVIALGVGIGVDYGIYIYSRLEHYLNEGMKLQEAYYETLRSTGKAVVFTGMTLGLGVVTWIFSPIKFQADMGLLLFFMFIWNMVGSIWLLPALARFLLKERSVPRN